MCHRNFQLIKIQTILGERNSTIFEENLRDKYTEESDHIRT